MNILSVLTLISLSLQNQTVSDIRSFLYEKINNYLQSEKREYALNIINNFRIGLLINERAVNLPMQLIPPLLNLLLEDISDYKYDYDGDTKYDCDYVVIISKLIFLI